MKELSTLGILNDPCPDKLLMCKITVSVGTCDLLLAKHNKSSSRTNVGCILRPMPKTHWDAKSFCQITGNYYKEIIGIVLMIPPRFDYREYRITLRMSKDLFFKYYADGKSNRQVIKEIILNLSPEDRKRIKRIRTLMNLGKEYRVREKFYEEHDEFL